MNWILPLVIVGVIVVVTVSIFPELSFEHECCSICESYWAYDALEDEKDNVIDDCLRELWDDYNNGKGSSRSQSHLGYLEKIRIDNDAGGRSFNLINLSNPCPISPKLKYLGTGYIVNYTPWSYDGPAYSVTRMNLNGSNWTFSNCGWHPYPYNRSNLSHAFREKWNSWFNRCKHAELYDATIYPDKPDSVNESWVEWEYKYQIYLDNGGVDVGDQY